MKKRLVRIFQMVLDKIGFKLIPKSSFYPNGPLDVIYGLGNTVKLKKPVNLMGEPIPWFTYPAIEFLHQLELRGKAVFEWGSGHSTLFFISRGAKVRSVESNSEWYEYIRTKANAAIIEERDGFDFVCSIENFLEKFDIIVIDSDYRYDCVLLAEKYLSDTGFIILDNSDWFPSSARFLREKQFIQIDFHGFGPCNAYTWTTSFFLRRNCIFESNQDRMPTVSWGGIDHISEFDRPVFHKSN